MTDRQDQARAKVTHHVDTAFAGADANIKAVRAEIVRLRSTGVADDLIYGLLVTNIRKYKVATRDALLGAYVRAVMRLEDAER